MTYRLLKLIVVLFSFVLTNSVLANQEEQHLSVAMRMIGHQLLLSSGDSTSRVLAIEKEEDQYSINFESEFAFSPDDLIPVISCVMEEFRIKNGYFVEVIDEATNSIIYNYEIGPLSSVDMIPCRMRTQPKGKYSIDITFVNHKRPNTHLYHSGKEFSQTLPVAPKQNNVSTPLLMASSLFILTGLFFYSRKKRLNSSDDPNLIAIGDSLYDKRNMKLSIEQQDVELTHKEAELLLLLHTSMNAPIERETILRKVWGDEGDYVGRTLDVFVSKLRKKIESDSSLKIVNIRGVGYKLVVNT